ncbi:hypothetical protein M409DRAFT_53983 [Zasmidium cellare ATCC 36951]|uniref:Uncharacterized protein n=1 Tax=Zasmidium cellare ATCC 36951 TaxID=1080233 RepID=A0A6A6CNR9_ZASCE|nr:uncharacterized protein M409DRAFT_53983 [Zasmidium cellare ATCC 36951]KAF2167379.1 hypothetical protein M409DRAFT_53983 [Zasmidium cellare ATCC 36951]
MRKSSAIHYVLTSVYTLQISASIAPRKHVYAAVSMTANIFCHGRTSLSPSLHQTQTPQTSALSHTDSPYSAAADKKGCDRQRPCERCAKRGLTAAECIEAPAPSSGAQPTTKKRSAPSSGSRPASKRLKKQTKKSASAPEDDEESEKNEEAEVEVEGGEETDVGDDQPEDQLVWREGDEGLAYDTEVSVNEGEEGEEGEEGSAGLESATDVVPEQAAGGDEGNDTPYYPTPTYSSLANRGIRIPVKTRENVASLPDKQEE